MKRLLIAATHPRGYVWRALRPWKRHSLVLAVAGTAYIGIGVTYMLATPRTDRVNSLQLAINIAPMDVWGTIWAFVGLLGVLSSRWPPASETWGYTLMSSLAALWGAFYLGGVALGAPKQSLSGALVWSLVAFLWWAVAGLKNPDRVHHCPHGGHHGDGGA